MTTACDVLAVRPPTAAWHRRATDKLNNDAHSVFDSHAHTVSNTHLASFGWIIIAWFKGHIPYKTLIPFVRVTQIKHKHAPSASALTRGRHGAPSKQLRSAVSSSHCVFCFWTFWTILKCPYLKTKSLKPIIVVFFFFFKKEIRLVNSLLRDRTNGAVCVEPTRYWGWCL